MTDPTDLRSKLEAALAPGVLEVAITNEDAAALLAEMQRLEERGNRLAEVVERAEDVIDTLYHAVNRYEQEVTDEEMMGVIGVDDLLMFLRAGRARRVQSLGEIVTKHA